MKASTLRTLFFLSGIAALLACGAWAFHTKPAFLRRAAAPERAFYFWKTQWNGSPVFDQALANGGIGKLYMRFFDVRWSSESGEALPVSPLRFASPPPHGLEIVPVVYLVNEIFMHLRYAEVEALADHVWKKTQEMAQAEGIHPAQIQIDCDWSEGTRRNYFHFAELLRGRLRPLGVSVSATIRLHQIKYAERTGIPPVDRGMLMFYNFGRIQADSPRSSIFNEADARRYSSYIGGYRLPLDISLPLFSWLVHSRDGHVLSLLEKLDPSELTAANGFRHASATRFLAERSFFFRGRYFMAGDLLLLEESSPETTRAAASLALQGAGWSKNYQTVALFDLDERNLSHYANHEIQGILEKF